MSSLSTHVLDATNGRPAAELPVRLERLAAPDDADAAVVAEAVTDADGRVAKLAAGLGGGVYRLVFDTGRYFAASGTAAFYPQVVVTFSVRGPEQHYHVPLLLSPFAYSTYRGS
jgi:5-hydroxyisourate hydrolase